MSRASAVVSGRAVRAAPLGAVPPDRLAALLGGLLVQVRAKETEVNASMLNGSFTLLLLCLALVTAAYHRQCRSGRAMAVRSIVG